MFLVALGSWSGLPWECLRASLQVVRYPTKIAPFRSFGAIAFPRSFQISVLRGFLGGLFGFIGRRCIFDCLVAFVGLVGLYACNVRRLGSEKRKTCKFIELLRSYVFSSCSCFVVACLVFVAWVVVVASLLCFVGCVVGGFLSLRTI